ncbi:MAG TPA: transglutaminase domain-containing protein [Phaeodactylibacter sp.]|nr:transglutaminase domain-containing protein [Phaeodactylibacter sp.]
MDYRIVYNGRRLTQKYGRKQVNNWILTDLPPLIDEPLCPNPEDYTESIRFQLAGYQRPLQIGGTQYVELMSTWENLAKEFLGHKDYLGILKKKTDSKKLLQKIISKEDSDLEKVKKIYAYVQKNIDWNEKYRLFPDEKFTTVFKNQKGSSAEINLCLVRLLQSAGLDANPLIISTKDNGLITKVYPIYNQFNHVIAQVNLGEKDILMDATSKFRPYNLISMDDLNPNGFLLSKKKSRWIEIPFPQKNRTIISSDLSFEGNLMKIKMTYSFFKYSAAKYRQRYHAEKGEDSFVTKYLQNNDEEMMLDSFKVRYAFNLEKPFAVTCYFTKEMDEEMGASILYIAPLLKKHYEKNPFINPTRYLPVDFIAPFSEKYIFNFRLPEGYELAEKPEPIRLATASKKSTYTYDFKQTQTTHVQISSIFEIKDPLIFFDEYGALRELFNKMMGLQSTQLVLKKK